MEWINCSEYLHSHLSPILPILSPCYPNVTLYNFCFHPWITIIVHCITHPPPPPQSSFVLSIVTCRNHKTENANCTFLASILLDPMDNQRIYTCAATHTCPSTKGLIFPPLSMTKRYITTTNPPKEVISLISGKTLRQKIRFSIGKKLILILICLVTLYTASLYQRRYLTSISFSL